MIYLKKGQPLFENPGMVVYDSTGYYNDGDSVVCAPVFAPEEPACRYEAQYIAYGGIIYSVSDPDELMKQVLAIDPKSLFGKDSQQVAVDKVVEDIVPQAETPVGGEASVPVENNATTTPAVLPNNTSTTTPDVVLPNNNTSTTTPDIVLPPNTSTTTQEVVLPDTSTTTPVTLPDLNYNNTSTTTPYTGIDTSTTTPSSATSTPIVTNENVSVSTSTPAQSSSPTPTPELIPTPTPTPVATSTPSVLDTAPASNTSTTTDEIVAYAKQKIVKKIFNI